MPYAARLALILPLAFFATPCAAQVQWLSWSINATEVTGGTVWVATSKATKPDMYTKTWSAAKLTPSWTRTNFQVSCLSVWCKPGPWQLTEPLPNARVVLSPNSQLSGATNVSVYWPVGTLAAPVTVAAVSSRTSAPALTMVAFSTDQLVVAAEGGTTPAARITTTASGWTGLRYAWGAGDQSIPLASGAKLTMGSEIKLIAPNGVVQKSWPLDARILLRPDNSVGVFQTLGVRMDTNWP
jgi:hypothetical protein